MARSRSAALLTAVGVLLVTGCAGPSLPDAEVFVCNQISLWVAEEGDVERARLVASSFEADVALSTTPTMTVAAERFIEATESADPADISDAGQKLTAACVDAGWEPPEG